MEYKYQSLERLSNGGVTNGKGDDLEGWQYPIPTGGIVAYSPLKVGYPIYLLAECLRSRSFSEQKYSIKSEPGSSSWLSRIVNARA